MRTWKDIIRIKRPGRPIGCIVPHLSIWERKRWPSGFITISLDPKHWSISINEGGPYFSFYFGKSLLRLWVRPRDLEFMIKWRVK